MYICSYLSLSLSCTVTLSLSVSNFVVCLGKCLTACWLSLLYGSTNSHQSCREFLLLHALRSPLSPPLSLSLPLSLFAGVCSLKTLCWHHWALQAAALLQVLSQWTVIETEMETATLIATSSSCNTNSSNTSRSCHTIHSKLRLTAVA